MSSPTPPIKVLIVDDEPVARRYLRELLAAEPDIVVAGECRDGAETVDWLAQHKADVVFMDIRMPRLGGFDALAKLDPARRPPVVFVTAFEEHAVKAFDCEALDYLLKPFDRQRLRQTLDRVRRRMAQVDPEQLTRQLDALTRSVGGRPDSLERIAVREGKDTRFVALEDVSWFEAESNYLRLHVGQKSHLIRMSLTQLEARLDPDRFSRIHRGIIVNVAKVSKLTSTGRGDAKLTLHDGTELTLSRRYRQNLDRTLKI